MYVLSPCKNVYRSQSQDKVDILVQTVYNNLRYVFVAVVYRMARKSRQNTPRNMYKGTAEILYFILPCRIVCLNIVRGFGCFSAFTGRAPTAGTYPARCAAPAPTAAAAAQARPAPDLGRGTFGNMRSGGVRRR